MNSKLDANKYKTVGTYPIIYLRYYTRSECINGGWGSDSKFNHYFSCSFTDLDADNLPCHLVIGKKKKHEISPIYFNCRIDRILDCQFSLDKYFCFSIFGWYSMVSGSQNYLSDGVDKSIDSRSRNIDYYLYCSCSIVTCDGSLIYYIVHRSILIIDKEIQNV